MDRPTFQKNKNAKQVAFNQIRGRLVEINHGDNGFSSVTIEVGHESIRTVNLVTRAENFKKFIDGIELYDRVEAKFYIVSHNKNGRWYTSAQILDLNVDSFDPEFNGQ